MAARVFGTAIGQAPTALPALSGSSAGRDRQIKARARTGVWRLRACRLVLELSAVVLSTPGLIVSPFEVTGPP